MYKGGCFLTFLNVVGDYFISHEKSGHAIQKEDIW